MIIIIWSLFGLRGTPRGRDPIAKSQIWGKDRLAGQKLVAPELPLCAYTRSHSGWRPQQVHVPADAYSASILALFSFPMCLDISESSLMESTLDHCSTLNSTNVNPTKSNFVLLFINN